MLNRQKPIAINTPRPIFSLRGRKQAARVKIALTLLAMTIGFTAAISWPADAVETIRLDAPAAQYQFTKTPDTCKRYLKMVDRNAGRVETARQIQNHIQGREKAAPVAVGLMLGVRVALGPKEIIKNNPRVTTGPELFAKSNGGAPSYALAIAAYRDCKNARALFSPR